MSRLLALVLACLIPTSEVLADTEFEDAVPLEFVLALLGNSPTGEVKLYSDIMDGFPDIEMPPSFSVLGSVDRHCFT